MDASNESNRHAVARPGYQLRRSTHVQQKRFKSASTHHSTIEACVKCLKEAAEASGLPEEAWIDDKSSHGYDHVFKGCTQADQKDQPFQVSGCDYGTFLFLLYRGTGGLAPQRSAHCASPEQLQPHVALYPPLMNY